MVPKYQVYMLMSGQAHLPYLVVSLYTLRKVMPDIDVVVYAWPESYSIVNQIAKDGRLNVTANLWEPAYRGKNSQFICKQVLGMLSSAEVKLYLDADTMILGDLTPLLDMAKVHGFCATQFNDWTTDGIVRGRIEKLRGREGIPQAVVDMLLDRGPWLSVNGGVFACRPESHVLPEWHRRTNLVRDIFIADETVLHTFVPEPRESNFYMAVAGTLDTCWNCSPKKKYEPNGVTDIRVRHFHGDSNVRPSKSPEGFAMWWPVYQECLEHNIGGVRDWIGSVNNKWLNLIEEQTEKNNEVLRP